MSAVLVTRRWGWIVRVSWMVGSMSRGVRELVETAMAVQDRERWRSARAKKDAPGETDRGTLVPGDGKRRASVRVPTAKTPLSRNRRRFARAASLPWAC